MAQRKLNIKLLMKLRNRFRRMKHKLHFDMKNWVTRNECGTAMCIAGTALVLSGKYKVVKNPEKDFLWPLIFVDEKGRRLRSSSIAPTGARLLGLPDDDACELFRRYDLETPKAAAVVIDRIIETGRYER